MRVISIVVVLTLEYSFLSLCPAGPITDDANNCYCKFSTSQCAPNDITTVTEGTCSMPSGYFDCSGLAALFSSESLYLGYTIETTQTNDDGTGDISCQYMKSCENSGPEQADVELLPLENDPASDPTSYPTIDPTSDPGTTMDECYCTFIGSNLATVWGQCMVPYQADNCQGVATAINELYNDRGYYYTIEGQYNAQNAVYVCTYRAVAGSDPNIGQAGLLMRAMGVENNDVWYETTNVQSLLWVCIGLFFGWFAIKTIAQCRYNLGYTDKYGYDKIGAAHSSEHVPLNYQSQC